MNIYYILINVIITNIFSFSVLPSGNNRNNAQAVRVANNNDMSIINER